MRQSSWTKRLIPSFRSRVFSSPGLKKPTPCGIWKDSRP
jgi:hypothetical protein